MNAKEANTKTKEAQQNRKKEAEVLAKKEKAVKDQKFEEWKKEHGLNQLQHIWFEVFWSDKV